MTGDDMVNYMIFQRRFGFPDIMTTMCFLRSMLKVDKYLYVHAKFLQFAGC